MNRTHRWIEGVWVTRETSPFFCTKWLKVDWDRGSCKKHRIWGRMDFEWFWMPLVWDALDTAICKSRVLNQERGIEIEIQMQETFGYWREASDYWCKYEQREQRKRKIFLIFYVYGFTYMYVSVMCVQCPQMPEEGVESPEIGVAEGCESLGTEPWSFHNWEAIFPTLRRMLWQALRERTNAKTTYT